VFRGTQVEKHCARQSKKLFVLNPVYVTRILLTRFYLNLNFQNGYHHKVTESLKYFFHVEKISLRDKIKCQ